MTRHLPRELERRVLSRYPGVAAADVARIEGVEPGQVRALREHHHRAGEDGLPGRAACRPVDAVLQRERELAAIDYLMRANRSAWA